MPDADQTTEGDVMHQMWSVLKLLIGLCIVSVFAYTALTFYRGAGHVGSVVTAPLERADELRRTALGWEQKPLEGSELEVAAASIAAGVAIDSEGEQPKSLVEVQHEMIDAHLRYKKLHPQLSYQEIVEKSRLWLPDDWQPWLWRDRPITMITRGRETTVARLKPVVAEKLRKETIPLGCADRYIRPGWHTGGQIAGEARARTRVALFPRDDRLKNSTATTQFFCSRVST